MKKASEFAVSKAFSTGNSGLSRRLWDQRIDLKTAEQIEDHDEVYAEGKKNCDVNSYLKYKFLKHDS